MKISIFLSAFAALALLSGCNSDDKQQASSQNDDGRVPILLSSGIGGDTRASQGLQNTQFRKNQTMDVQITSQDNMTGYDMLTYFASDNAGTLQPHILSDYVIHAERCNPGCIVCSAKK